MESGKEKSNFWSDFFFYFSELMCVLGIIAAATAGACIILGGFVLAACWFIMLPVGGQIAVFFGILMIAFVIIAAMWAKADNS